MNRNHTLLVVDDEPRNIDIIENIFSDPAEYNIHSVNTGEAALEQLSDIRPNLVLLDIMLPGINGFEVCRQIRSNPCFDHIKIVFVSGQVSLDDKIDGYEAGGDDYIMKPFDSREIYAKINVLLNLSRNSEPKSIQSDFINLVSHQINSPLSGMSGCADLILLQELMNDDVKSLADHISYSGKKLQHFIDQVGVLMELKSVPNLNKKSYSLSDGINHLLDGISDKITEKYLNVFKSIDHNITLQVDTELIEKALYIIIENAVQYSYISENIIIGITSCDNKINIHITNKGIAIPTDAFNVFEDFSTRDLNICPQGRGLSLPIAQLIVNLHGGAITVKTTHDNKITFTISLPIRNSSLAQNCQKNSFFIKKSVNGRNMSYNESMQ